VEPTEPAGGELEQRRNAIVDHPWRLPWQRPFLDALSRMPNVSAAARIVGVNYSYAYETRRADAVFAAAWQEAIDVAVDLLERIAHQRATTGEPRVSRRTRRKRELNAAGAMVLVEEETVEVEEQHVSDALLQFLLKAHRPDKFRERIDHRVSGGDAPVQIEEVYRIPARDRVAGLLELARQHEIAEVIEGTATSVPVNGNQPQEDDVANTPD
jgi:hypothetical protein